MSSTSSSSYSTNEMLKPYEEQRSRKSRKRSSSSARRRYERRQAVEEADNERRRKAAEEADNERRAAAAERNKEWEKKWKESLPTSRKSSVVKMDYIEALETDKRKFKQVELTEHERAQLCELRKLSEGWGYFTGSGSYEANLNSMTADLMSYSDIVFRNIMKACTKERITTFDIDDKIVKINRNTMIPSTFKACKQLLESFMKDHGPGMKQLVALRKKATSWQMAKICDAAAALMAFVTHKTEKKAKNIMKI